MGSFNLLGTSGRKSGAGILFMAGPHALFQERAQFHTARPEPHRPQTAVTLRSFSIPHAQDCFLRKAFGLAAALTGWFS